ncbi:MAG: RecQ family ATP-dependent DNA helicase [Myxococcaceae bacterium]
MRRMSLAAAPLPFLDEARRGLHQHFALTGFRPGQAEVVSSILEQKNTVVVMPTGAGKSLCYQLPATLLPGITVVVSPLIALMKDQVEQLNARGIAATFINSTLSDLERGERMRELRERKFKLVYVAPERFRSQAFVDMLTEVGVDLFAVDEAHCISQWGHDFRPEYAQLGQVRKRLRPPRTVALTATATPEVRQDIVRVLLMKEPRVFVAGFDRANLFLEVVPVRGDEDRRQVSLNVVKEGGSGIIYASTRKGAEMIQSALKGKGLKPLLYHAGMEDDDRRRAQDAFMSEKDAVVVATNAFGMGIDKADIRFVVHASIPRAIEAYYQEIGRAGRDGLPARAVLLFNHADVYTQERMIQSSHPSETCVRDVWEILRHAETYEFGIQHLKVQTASNEFEISAALRILERAGKIERGSRGEGAWEIQLSSSAHGAHVLEQDAKTLYAALKSGYPEGRSFKTELRVLARKTGLTEEKVRRELLTLERSHALTAKKPFAGRVIRTTTKAAFPDLGLNLQRIREQEQQALLLLKRMTDYAYARRCRRAVVVRYFGEETEWENCGGCDLCAGKRTQRPAAMVDAPAPNAALATMPFSELAMLELRRWRTELAQDLEIPPYLIFGNAALEALASALPITKEEFLKVKGTGEARWERFGAKVVEICLLARAAGHVPAAMAEPVRKRRRA